jgi:hypothetical protein
MDLYTQSIAPAVRSAHSKVVEQIEAGESDRMGVQAIGPE